MIPLVTNSWRIERPTNLSGDSSDALDFEEVASGVPGTLSFPTGSESVVQGDRERVDARIFIDVSPAYDVHAYDRIVDEATGDTWSVAFARRRAGLGLDHWNIGVYAVTGVARGTRDL